MRSYRSYSDEDLEKAVIESRSIRQALLKLGLADKGGNYKTLRKHIARLKLDTTHFGGQTQGLKPFKSSAIEDLLVVDSAGSFSWIRKRVKEENILPYNCSECGVTNWWNYRTLVLHLDHINGVRTDNRISNLRWLCPNCHSQTSTYCRKKSSQQ